MCNMKKELKKKNRMYLAMNLCNMTCQADFRKTCFCTNKVKWSMVAEKTCNSECEEAKMQAHLSQQNNKNKNTVNCPNMLSTWKLEATWLKLINFFLLRDELV